MFTLPLLLALIAPAWGCDDLLADLRQVRRAGQRLFGQVEPGRDVTLGRGEPRDVEITVSPPDGAEAYPLAVRLPLTVRLTRIEADGRLRVALPDDAGAEFEVAPADLAAHGDALVRETRAALRLRALKTEPLTFATGEVVRVRVDGVMTSGHVTGLGDVNVVEVDGVARAADQVFKAVGPRPATPIHPAGTRRALALTVPTGSSREFLDRVARWTSRADFRGLATRDKLTLLARLGAGVGPWHDSPFVEDRTRNQGMDELLERGFGVCRQVNPLTAAILSETGYPVRLVHYRDHLWTEAQVTDGRGRRETWVVEASCRTEDRAGAWRRRDLKRRPTEHGRAYYLQPGRVVEFQSPGWR